MKAQARVVYTLGVATRAMQDPQPASAPARGKFRRRPPTSQAERDRRVAWGKQWGAILSEHAKTYKRKR